MWDPFYSAWGPGASPGQSFSADPRRSVASAPRESWSRSMLLKLSYVSCQAEAELQGIPCNSMVPQIISASHPELKCNDLHISKRNASKIEPIQFGSFPSFEKQCKEGENNMATDTWRKKIFMGINLRKEEKQARKELTVQIGSVAVRIAI